MNIDLLIEPECAAWEGLAGASVQGDWLGRPLSVWRAECREQLRLPADQAIIATGHQSMLWHPGILAKYLLVNEVVNAAPGVAAANLVVDQHVGAFGEYDVPIRRADELGTMPIALTESRDSVPMGRHSAFAPQAPPSDLPAALDSVTQGMRAIHEATVAHRNADSAARQLAEALADLMSRWVAPMPNVTATDLINTDLARAILAQMAEEPDRCIHVYNEAVAAVPEGGVAPLAGSGDHAEAPIWRIGDDDRRRRGVVGDLRRWLDGRASFALLPRALLMTALVRIGMCDLFVHGTGGAAYDRAMELWINNWLGLEVAPHAVATATVRLPFPEAGDERLDFITETRRARRLWHDPAQAIAIEQAPSPAKRAFIDEIANAPRRSAARATAFRRMHEALGEARHQHEQSLQAARRLAQRARRQRDAAGIIDRRTWAFPLYPIEVIDSLAEAVRKRVQSASSA